MKKSKFLAAFLSVLAPGLGSFYAQKPRKSFTIIGLFVIFAISIRFLSFNLPMLVVALLLVLGWTLFAIVAAVRDVDPQKTYPAKAFDKWYVYVLIILLMSGFGLILQSPASQGFGLINFSKIPTPAMDPTLVVGDRMAYELTSGVDRNDVVLFKYPPAPETMYVKRCIAQPGDSVKIKNSVVYVNGSPERNTAYRYRYEVITDGSQFSDRALRSLKVTDDNFYPVSPGHSVFFLTGGQVDKMRTLPFVKQVVSTIGEENAADQNVFPGSPEHPWNADFFGPLYLPRKGDKIQLSEKNIRLYQSCIKYENADVVENNGKLYINDEPVTEYQFRDDYYFMMGDNRHNSLDSRYWGFVPGKYIIGKALYVYMGKTFDRIGEIVK